VLHPGRRTGLLVGGLGLLWGWRLRRLQTSVRRYAASWAASRDEPGAPGALLHVALGDSAAQGIGASRPERGWVGLLAARLALAQPRPVHLVNLSVSGARLADVVAGQLPALRALPRPPDLLTVAVGGNDLRHHDAEGFARDLEALVAGLPVGPTVLADVPFFGHGRAERDAAAAAALLRAAAQARGLVVAELHELMRLQGWRALGSWAADGFHPGDRGHRTWAEAFWRALTADEALRARLGLQEDLPYGRA
jgi:acyl-CoA thioesterase-1